MTEKEILERIQAGRQFMHMDRDEDDDYKTDQMLKKPQPPLTKEAVSDIRIKLPSDFSSLNIDNDFLHIINSRVSNRVYTEEDISLLQLSYLLWCTQGVKEIRGRAYATLRTVPCGGARHEFETYLAVAHVKDLKPGFYHYLPMSHELELLQECSDLPDFIGKSLNGQVWGAKASVVFYYSMVAYRAEWRYGIHAHRIALVDAGYISENLYLACTSIGLGSCAIGSISEDICNSSFGLDGDGEFIFLAHPVGTVTPADKQKELDFYAFVKEQNL